MTSMIYDEGLSVGIRNNNGVFNSVSTAERRESTKRSVSGGVLVENFILSRCNTCRRRECWGAHIKNRAAARYIKGSRKAGLTS